jgi:hypothetical protein
MEIEISSSDPEIISEYLQEAAGDLFEIFKQETGIRPLE